MTSPIFSIIIPTYNRPDFLFRAIESVLQQSFQDFEVLVINDGSNKGLDEYDNIIKKCNEISSSIQFISKENGGVSSARNLGFEVAKGNYICFLDDDDYYLSNHLEKLFELIKKNNFSIGFYRTFTKFLNNKGELIDQTITQYKTVNNKGNIDYLYIQVIVPVNICISKEILNRLKFNEELTHGEDYELWVRILNEYPFYQIDIITTVYDRSNETASSGSIEKFFKYINTFDVLCNNANLTKVLSKKLRTAIYEKYYSWIIDYYLKNNPASFKLIERDIKKRTSTIFFIKNKMKFFIKK